MFWTSFARVVFYWCKIMPVTFTKSSLPFGWLGNMSPFPIKYAEREWRTAEALFQALRFVGEDGSWTENLDIISAIWREKSPMGAKFAAKKNVEKMVVKPLSEKDLANMEMVLRLKLEQHPELVDQLLATGDELIIEDVSSRADVKSNNLLWGMARIADGSWVGKNLLGSIWMKIRSDLALKS